MDQENHTKTKDALKRSMMVILDIVSALMEENECQKDVIEATTEHVPMPVRKVYA